MAVIAVAVFFVCHQIVDNLFVVLRIQSQFYPLGKGILLSEHANNPVLDLLLPILQQLHLLEELQDFLLNLGFVLADAVSGILFLSSKGLNFKIRNDLSIFLVQEVLDLIQIRCRPEAEMQVVVFAELREGVAMGPSMELGGVGWHAVFL